MVRLFTFCALIRVYMHILHIYHAFLTVCSFSLSALLLHVGSPSPPEWKCVCVWLSLSLMSLISSAFPPHSLNALLQSHFGCDALYLHSLPNCILSLFAFSFHLQSFAVCILFLLPTHILFAPAAYHPMWIFQRFNLSRINLPTNPCECQITDCYINKQCDWGAG